MPDPPVGTYRVQLRAEFGFAAAASLVRYLDGLGISHLYGSPVMQAAVGSTHGYDVVDVAEVSAELGGSQAFDAMVAALREAGLGLLLDIVPNHMAAVPENGWWWDVLRRGPGSQFAGYFDIDWEPPDADLRGRVLLPVLGEPLEAVLEHGRLRIERRGSEWELRYFDKRFPLAQGPPDSGPDMASSGKRMQQILERQHYRLEYWRTALPRLNYRRFFDISSLIGLRVEEPAVFDDVHRLVLRWLGEGKLQGLRIDHIDGLRDPLGYLQKLRQRAGDIWILVEKILQPGEPLAADWPVHGTTGYDFMNLALGLFVDGGKEVAFSDLYREFAPEATASYEDTVEATRRLALESLFTAELRRLESTLCGIEQVGAARLDKSVAEAALRELLVSFPVYRTYAGSGRATTPHDRAVVAHAVDAAGRRRPELKFALGRLGDVLCDGGEEESDFVARFQQLSGPLMAKAEEDTAFYRYNRLLCLNEVGGAPSRFGVGAAEFHQHNHEVQAARPLTMLATSTHDTKRGEDVRARLALLSEIPERWRALVFRWSAHNVRHRTNGVPDRNTEYLLYQTLVGAHPLTLERARAYSQKAAREAKLQTSWLDPNLEYEQALDRFVEGLFSDGEFQDELRAFVDQIKLAGFVNGLAFKLLALTSPGVPDCYQGSELWDLSLVDPDNRRPVDYALRERLLATIDQLSPEQIWTRADEGLPKLLLVTRSLQLRRRRPDCFDGRGDYRPLYARGAKAGHVIAFLRGRSVTVVVPRLVLGLEGRWMDTQIALGDGRWRNLLDDSDGLSGRVALAELLGRFPVALLERQD